MGYSTGIKQATHITTRPLPGFDKGNPGKLWDHISGMQNMPDLGYAPICEADCH
jgi:hypothetical protein